MNERWRRLSCLALASGSICHAVAQNADDQYLAAPDDGAVWAIALQTDGRALVGGEFTAVNGQPCHHVCRLNADGSVDATFGDPLADATVYALALQPDGRVLVGGAFGSIGAGVPATHHALARLNGDGSIDATFVDEPIVGAVSALIVQADGNVVAGGNFTLNAVQTRQFLARFDSGGAVDASFIDPAADQKVQALAQQSDGKLLVGGYFTILGGHAHSAIARLNTNGSDDTPFAPVFAGGGGPTPGVLSMALQDDGALVVGGAFTSVDAQPRTYLARLATSGTLQAGFAPSSDNSVFALALQADGKILVGGAFTSIAGLANRNLVRLNPDGSRDVGFDPAPGISSFVLAVAAQSDGKALLGGAFNGTPHPYLARLNSDGSIDGTLANANAGDTVYALAVQADDRILVGDCINPVAGDHCPQVTRLRADGSSDSSFVETGGYGYELDALTLQNDARIWEGGDLSTVYAGQPGENLYRFDPDGSLDNGFSGALTDHPTYSVVMQTDGKALVTGTFTTVGGQTRHHLARLNANGSVDSGFADTNADNDIYTAAVQPDGKILVGGAFTFIGSPSLSRPLVARLNSNGTLDSSFVGPPLSPNNVTAIALQADGKILIVGDFVSSAGYYIARLNTDGSLDSGFIDPNLDSNLYSVTLQADGKILIAGVFSHVGTPPQAQRHMARLNVDGSIDTTFADPNTQGIYVLALAQQADGKILVGGAFTQIGAPLLQPRQNFARLSIADPAVQTLRVNADASVTWLRAGAAPELVLPPLLQYSTDGQTYSDVGTMTRIAGGWSRHGVLSPNVIGQPYYLRALGRIGGGEFNSSQGVVQSVRIAYASDRIFADGFEP
jgi:uncharacterized delta-60 repeat protein